jgi:hypothetical protein
MENWGLIVFFIMLLAVLLMWIINANQGSNLSERIRNGGQSTFDNFSGEHSTNSYYDSYGSTDYDRDRTCGDSSHSDSSGGDSACSDSTTGNSE